MFFIVWRKTHKITLQKNQMQIKYYVFFFEKLFQNPPNLTRQVFVEKLWAVHHYTEQ